MSGTVKALWDRFLPEVDRQVYEKAGLGGALALGSRLAILVVDVQRRSLGNSPKPVLEAMEDNPAACGHHGWSALPHIQQLIETGRQTGVPVIYTILARRTSSGRWGDKMPRFVASREHHELAIKPNADEYVLEKARPSVFFGTPLVTHLTELGIDTVIVTGCTTSGCIRATVVDAFSYGYRVAVPFEAVYDRVELSHAVGLWDMDAKYANVTDTERICKHLRKLSTLDTENHGQRGNSNG